MSFGEIPMPMTEHSPQILVGAWPSQSEVAWGGFEMELSARGRAIAGQYDTQFEIARGLQNMSGPFIDDAGIPNASKRETTLQESAKTDHTCSDVANSARRRLAQAKEDMVDIVKRAEKDITAKREQAATKKAKARAKATPLTAAAVEAECQAIDAQLKIDEQTIVAAAHASAMAADSTAAADAAGYGARVKDLTLTYPANTGTGPSTAATPMSNGIGGAPAAPAPTSPGGGINAQNVDSYSVGQNPSESGATRLSNPLQEAQNNLNPDNRMSPPKVEPASAVTDGSPGSSSPLAGSPSQSGGAGSLIGHMMSPLSSAGGASSGGGSSPLSSMGSGLGNFGNAGGANPASAQGASMLNPGAAGLPAAGTGAGTGAGAGGGSGLAGLGAGAAETSARLASGAVSGVANGLNAAANAGSQVAQNVAPAVANLASQASPAANPAALTTPASAGGVGGAPTMGMMPPAGGVGGGGPVTPISGGGSGPTPPPSPAAPSAGGGGGPSSSLAGVPPAAAQYAPLAMAQQQHPGIRSLGADGTSGTVLIDQAMAAGADVITALLAQTTLAGYAFPLDYAVSLIYERTGGVTAWLATSEGASYIPLGVRIPQDVKLAITDPIAGRALWDSTAADGGSNPLKVLVEHAKARVMSAPGIHVLAIASSIKMANAIDWADELNAQPVEVPAAKFITAEAASAAAATIGHTLHRCEVAMPWEWQQANASDERERLRLAVKQMHLAFTVSHLNGPACEQVMRLFELRERTSDELWGAVKLERLGVLVDYDTAKSRISYGAPELARLLAKARAAEVVESLRRYNTVEGFADLLYASRLAGAPLSPADAVV